MVVDSVVVIRRQEIPLLLRRHRLERKRSRRRALPGQVGFSWTHELYHIAQRFRVPLAREGGLC